MTEDATKKTKSYLKLKKAIRELYLDGLSEREANEATRNFIGFAELLLEIKKEQKCKIK